MEAVSGAAAGPPFSREWLGPSSNHSFPLLKLAAPALEVRILSRGCGQVCTAAAYRAILAGQPSFATIASQQLTPTVPCDQTALAAHCCSVEQVAMETSPHRTPPSLCQQLLKAARKPQGALAGDEQ